jgi:hypothetical protein
MCRHDFSVLAIVQAPRIRRRNADENEDENEDEDVVVDGAVVRPMGCGDG